MRTLRYVTTAAIFPTIAVLFLSSCAILNGSGGRGNKYTYNYTLLAPIASSRLAFEDDSLMIQFRFDDGALQFRIANLSDVQMRIDWSETTIGVSGRYSSVRHSENIYHPEDINMLSRIVPPNGFTVDFVIPRENIQYVGNRWSERDLLLTTDFHSAQLQERIRGNVGSRVALLMPVLFGHEKRWYTFEFVVTSIRRIPWSAAQSPVRPVTVPPRDSEAGGPTRLDTVYTAAAFTGMLGAAIYIMTLKKKAPSE